MEGAGSIHDMRVLNTDAVSYQSKTPEKVLVTAEREKKKKYLHSCLNKRRHFTAFSGLRLRRHLNASPSAFRKSGRSCTHVPAST